MKNLNVFFVLFVVIIEVISFQMLYSTARDNEEFDMVYHAVAYVNMAIVIIGTIIASRNLIFKNIVTTLAEDIKRINAVFGKLTSETWLVLIMYITTTFVICFAMTNDDLFVPVFLGILMFVLIVTDGLLRTNSIELAYLKGQMDECDDAFKILRSAEFDSIKAAYDELQKRKEEINKDGKVETDDVQD